MFPLSVLVEAQRDLVGFSFSLGHPVAPNHCGVDPAAGGITRHRQRGAALGSELMAPRYFIALLSVAPFKRSRNDCGGANKAIHKREREGEGGRQRPWRLHGSACEPLTRLSLRPRRALQMELSLLRVLPVRILLEALRGTFGDATA